MKTLIQKYLPAVAVLILVAGCDADISGNFGDDPDPGSADFSTFVALGDSLTAGYADSALYRHGQENSFPAIMAQQFVSVGGGAFNQPLMPIQAFKFHARLSQAVKFNFTRNSANDIFHIRGAIHSGQIVQW